MAFLDDLELKDFTGTIPNVKQRPAGGTPYYFITLVESLLTENGGAVTFDADGCISSFTLAPDAPFICLRPVQDENTTGSIPTTRAGRLDAVRYTQSFTLEVPTVGKEVLKLEAILKNECDFAIFEYDNCCQTFLHGIDVEKCEDPARIKPQLEGITFGNGGGLETNTITGSRVKTWVFNGVSLCASPLVNTTLTDLQALKTNV